MTTRGVERVRRGVLELDPRRRASLGKFGKKEHTQYIVEEDEDGGLHLIPSVTMSERELALMADPERVAKIKQGLEQSRAGRSRVVSFAQYLDDDEDDEP